MSQKHCLMKNGQPLTPLLNHSFSSVNHSSLALISYKNGFVKQQLQNEAFNKNSFLDFLKNNLTDYQNNGYYLILDNVRFHHAVMVKEYLKEINILPIFITKYSPEQNPIEYIFSQVKTYIRKSVECCNVKKMKELIERGYSELKVSIIQKCFIKSLTNIFEIN